MAREHEERAERVARNESRFRELNEALERGLRNVARGPERAGFVCECGDDGCHALVKLALERYEQVRANPRRFLIVPGHDDPDVEAVVERGESYAVVEKFGGSVDHIVKREDPRRGGA